MTSFLHVLSLRSAGWRKSATALPRVAANKRVMLGDDHAFSTCRARRWGAAGPFGLACVLFHSHHTDARGVSRDDTSRLEALSARPELDTSTSADAGPIQLPELYTAYISSAPVCTLGIGGS